MTLPDKADLARYGGKLENAWAISNPKTDLDAGAFNECRSDVAGMTKVVTRAVASFVGHATTPTSPLSGFVHTANWGETAGVKPATTKGGTGIYDLTWPTQITDELGTLRAVNFRRAKGWAEGAVAYHVQCEVLSANVIRARVFDMAGAAVDAAGVTITVEAL